MLYTVVLLIKKPTTTRLWWRLRQGQYQGHAALDCFFKFEDFGNHREELRASRKHVLYGSIESMIVSSEILTGNGNTYGNVLGIRD